MRRPLSRVVAGILLSLVAGACIATSTVEGQDPLPGDGALDCLGDAAWAADAALDPNASGPPTAQEALAAYFEGLEIDYGGKMVMVGETSAVLLVDNRDVMAASVVEGGGGGWVVVSASGCQGFEPAPIGGG